MGAKIVNLIEVITETEKGTKVDYFSTDGKVIVGSHFIPKVTKGMATKLSDFKALPLEVVPVNDANTVETSQE
jgi:hypothetical protein